MSTALVKSPKILQMFEGMPLVTPPRPIKGMKITVLGCGTSAGVPHLACSCSTCLSKNPKNNRTRASVLIQVGSKNFLIDTSPDLRAQALKNKIFWLDAVLFTHPHADHVHGIDELRSFNFLMKRPIKCYGDRPTLEALKSKFDYIFNYTQEGGGKPQIDLHAFANSNKPKTIAGVQVRPLELVHGKVTCIGYRIKDVAYLTDLSYIPDHTFRHLNGLEVLILDCLRFKKHPTHLNVEESLALAKKIGARRTYFTHMGHELEYKKFARSLPKNMYPAHDGLTITIK